MKSTLVRTETSDNVQLHGLQNDPSTKTSKAVLFIHGIHGNFYADRFISTFASTFTQNGYTFLSGNTRGHDHLGSSLEIFHDSIQDIKAWIDYLAQKNIDEIALIGHSLGGSKVVYYLAKTQDTRVKKIVLISPTPLTIFKKDPIYSEILILAKEMANAGNGGEIMPKKILGKIMMSANTFLHYQENLDALYIFGQTDSTQESLLSKIHVPLYSVWGSKDKYGALFSITETMEYIKAKSTNLPYVDTNIIENAGHSYVDFEEDLTTCIMNWLKKS